jgi:hypothetical protein
MDSRELLRDNDGRCEFLRDRGIMAEEPAGVEELRTTNSLWELPCDMKRGFNIFEIVSETPE